MPDYCTICATKQGSVEHTIDIEKLGQSLENGKYNTYTCKDCGCINIAKNMDGTITFMQGDDSTWQPLEELYRRTANIDIQHNEKVKKAKEVFENSYIHFKAGWLAHNARRSLPLSDSERHCEEDFKEYWRQINN